MQSQADVDSGRVRPEAMGEFAAQRRQLEAAIDAASADRAIDARERNEAQSILVRMGETGRRWSGGRVYGGGPRVVRSAGENLYESNWRRLW